MTAGKKKVLVTGAAGNIGRIFPAYYADRYDLVLMDNREVPDASPGAEVVIADITDTKALRDAMEGVYAVVHLAADGRPFASWDSVLANNIVGTHAVFEAANEADVRRVVYASSVHACAEHLREFGPVGPDAPIRPDSLYGVSKTFGESLARFYSDQHGLSVVCLRIGTCSRSNDLDRMRYYFNRMLSRQWVSAFEAWQHLALWISHADMAQLLHRSIEARVQFGIFYGASDNDPPVFDLSETRRQLGYAPVDSVQALLGEPYGPDMPPKPYIPNELADAKYGPRSR